MKTMQHFFGKFLLVFALFCTAGIVSVAAKPTPDGLPVIAATELPKQAQETIALIKAGGPFPYSRDGIVFSNREKILPKEKRGYYKEYTVKTPGAKNRGARRIVTGGEGQFYYSDDHYASFKRVLEK
jgi:ribonuclease T1